ncbi:MAG: DUF493 domain-containing protein [Campylobacterota bacterium]|nr:DUF493 domain-containing protein [Campylobacterota bacterium]
MVLDNSCKTRPDIDYPTTWHYKIIGRDEKKLLASIQAIMKELGNKTHHCAMGNKSKNGKFTTYNTSCTVENEEERNKIFKYFEDHEHIEMVI